MATIGNLWINVKSNTTGLSKGLGKAKGMLGKFGKFATSPAGMAVAAFAALTIGVIAAGKAIMSATREFMAFEAGMAEVKSILLDVSDSDFGRLEDSAKKLGATTAFTAEQAAGGMANLARAGFDTNEILAATPAVLNLAAATGMDLAETANIAAVAVRGFGLAATETAHVADVLALAASKTNTTVAEMGDAFSYVAPVANQLGFSIEETSAMLGKLADAGIKGSKGGTALRTIMLKMGSAIEKGGTQALTDYFKAQHSVTENMEKFGKIGVTAAGVLSGVTDETKELATAMEEAVGVVDKMAEARLDTLQGDVTLFQSAVSGLKTEIGEKLAPTFRAMVQVATKFIGGMQAAFTSVFGAVEGSIISTETLTTVFKVVGGVIIWVFGIVTKLWNQFMFGINLIKTLLYGLLTVISGIVTAIVAAVSWGLNKVGLMSDETYDDVVNTMTALTSDLATSTGEAAVDAGGNFMMGYAGGAEMASADAFKVMSDSMDGIGTDAGESLTDGLAESIEEGTPKVANAVETLTDVQMELVESGTKLNDKLQEQITYFGMSEAQILNVKAAETGLTSATIAQTLALEAELQALKDAETAKQKAISDAKALADAAAKVIESLRTDEQVYSDEVVKLQEMFDAKLLTIEQFQKAVDNLKTSTEEDIEVNIVTKGVIEGLQTAMGSIKIGGQVTKTEQLAEKQVETSKKIEQVMASVRENTSAVKQETVEVANNTQDVANKLAGTLTTDVTGLESMMGTVVTSIDNISNDNQMDETEQLLTTSNDLSVRELTELQNINRNILAMQSGGALS